MITPRICFLLVSLAWLCQAEDEPAAINATLCELAEHPEQYIGKMINVRAKVVGDLSIDDFEQPRACSSWMGFIVVLPERVRPRPDFDVIRDGSFDQLFAELRKGMNVQATFEGRFDAVYTRRNQKRVWVADGGDKSKGFGKKGQYGGRIVLHRVSEILARPLPRK